MPKPEKKHSAAMNTDLATLTNVVLKPIEFDVTQPLSLAEWQDVGRRFSMAMRTVAFVIGDWLVYGEGRDGQMMLFADIPESDRISKQLYEAAIRLGTTIFGGASRSRTGDTDCHALSG